VDRHLAIGLTAYVFLDPFVEMDLVVCRFHDQTHRGGGKKLYRTQVLYNFIGYIPYLSYEFSMYNFEFE
jgi:hypothetical protein